MGELEEARIVLDTYFSALGSQNWEKLQACFAHDESLTYIGTDDVEIWLGWKKAEPFLRSQIESFERVVATRSPLVFRETIDKDAVLFAEEAEMTITSYGKPHYAKIRLSGVIEKRTDGWAITQFHRSVAPPKPVVIYPEHHMVRYQ